MLQTTLCVLVFVTLATSDPAMPPPGQGIEAGSTLSSPRKHRAGESNSSFGVRDLRCQLSIRSRGARVPAKRSA